MGKCQCRRHQFNMLLLYSLLIALLLPTLREKLLLQLCRLLCLRAHRRYIRLEPANQIEPRRS